MPDRTNNEFLGSGGMRHFLFWWYQFFHYDMDQRQSLRSR